MTQTIQKQFKDLRPGDLVELDDGETATILSAPVPGIAEGLLMVEIGLASGEVEYADGEPEDIVYVAVAEVSA